MIFILCLLFVAVHMCLTSLAEMGEWYPHHRVGGSPRSDDGKPLLFLSLFPSVFVSVYHIVSALAHTCRLTGTILLGTASSILQPPNLSTFSPVA